MTYSNLVDAAGLEYFFDQIYLKYLQWIGTCVQQESGKGLSTNDYTTAEKNKLSGIATGAQVNVIESVKVNGSALTVTNKAVDITVPSLSGYATETWVSDKLNDILGINASGVSTLAAVLADNDLTTGILSAISAKADSSSLATVATSGSYNDLSDKPTIPSEYVLQKASASTLGGIKVGTGLSIDNSGVLSASASSYSNATSSADGLMSSTDKSKLDGIASGATAVTESTVSGWGFTKNTGTLTSSDISDMATKTWVGQQGYTTNAGTITKVGNTSSGAVTVSSSNNTASWGSAVTVGSVGGVDLKFTMPGNPDTAPVSSVAGNTGAVTAAQIATALTSAGYKLTDTDTNTTYSAGTGLSLSGTTFNHSNSITAQTTQAVYPIKIDAQGHISAYGSAVTIPTNTNQLTNGAGYITGITKSMVTTALGYTPPTSDTNTTYSAGSGLSLSGTTFSLALTKALVTSALGYTPPTTDTNTTYSAGTALSLSGTTFNHSNYATAGTAGTSSATSGSTLAVPYVTVNAQGHVTGYGTHTHTVSGFLTSHQDISGKQNKIPTSTASTTGTVSLACDTMYNIGTLTGNITFNLTAAPSDGYMHEWMFSFDVGSTAYTVTMPSGVTFPSSVSIAANKHYEVNIKGTYGLIASW